MISEELASDDSNSQYSEETSETWPPPPDSDSQSDQQAERAIFPTQGEDINTSPTLLEEASEERTACSPPPREITPLAENFADTQLTDRQGTSEPDLNSTLADERVEDEIVRSPYLLRQHLCPHAAPQLDKGLIFLKEKDILLSGHDAVVKRT
ncbi:hypothetical protein L9F63_008397, partial [Diploptera punctata]